MDCHSATGLVVEMWLKVSCCHTSVARRGHRQLPGESSPVALYTTYCYIYYTIVLVYTPPSPPYDIEA